MGPGLEERTYKVLREAKGTGARQCPHEDGETQKKKSAVRALALIVTF